MTEQNTVVDLSGLNTGVYFVRVVDDDGVSVGKVVKR
ncbi:MAG: T9SS type A sorting domain-containing protein [Bacteroidales bacterium]|nr:T9SS type A sorting domain-containing protein [Bacteroidales bacterium]